MVVRSPCNRIRLVAVNMLLCKINGSKPISELKFKPELIVRQATAA
ncbi:hypothetical protein [Paenibacillus jiagnxiensis]